MAAVPFSRFSRGRASQSRARAIDPARANLANNKASTAELAPDCTANRCNREDGRVHQKSVRINWPDTSSAMPGDQVTWCTPAFGLKKRAKSDSYVQTIPLGD